MLVTAKQQRLSGMAKIVGIGIDRADNIREFAAMYKINYPLLIGDATTPSLLRTLGNTGGALPYTVVLDRRGTLVGRKLGVFTDAELRQVLASLIS